MGCNGPCAGLLLGRPLAAARDSRDSRKDLIGSYHRPA
jgi:hypothetical protein